MKVETDRELLELAAKAAGIAIDHWTDDRDGVPVAVYANDNGGAVFWQPLLANRLTDCMGDALRLAVKLRMPIQPMFTMGGKLIEVSAYPSGRGDCLSIENVGGDEFSATRRAIVRAAAEIGKSMQ